jgi:hypothetical protein
MDGPRSCCSFEHLAKIVIGGGLKCQGTTSVVPQMAKKMIPALAAADLQIIEKTAEAKAQHSLVALFRHY